MTAEPPHPTGRVSPVDLTGKLIAWNIATDQPYIAQFPGLPDKFFVLVFSTMTILVETMRQLGETVFQVLPIRDGPAFVRECFKHTKPVSIALDLRTPEPGKFLYSDVLITGD